jgi:hypothetical protein
MGLKRSMVLFLIVLGLASTFLIYRFGFHTGHSSPGTPLPHNFSGSEKERDEGSLQLYRFIKAKLTGPYGTYTNYQDTDQSGEAATGHEVLSESASLKLRYLALTGQKEAFDEEWATVKKVFQLEHGFSYRYSPKLDKKYPVNAAVDDLRIIRALYEAEAVFHDGRYKSEADVYGKRFYASNTQNGALYDFYDEASGKTNRFVTLCYVDLKTLGLLPVSGNERRELIGNMEDIAKNGYISDLFPFYESRYNYDVKSYDSGSINMVESLLTVLNLAEVNLEREASIRYLKDRVASGTLYGQYSREGKALNQVQSTALYALAAMIGSEVGDETLYRESIQRMDAFRVNDSANPLNGGFGDPKTLQAYSFDNWMALLAYTYD